MVASRSMGWFRCVLTAGLCYALVLQVMLVQAAGVEAAAGMQTVICHGDGDQNQNELDRAPLAQCHFCLMPATSVALLPGSISEVAIVFAVVVSDYAVFADGITVTRPPPRGASRAPPHFA